MYYTKPITRETVLQKQPQPSLFPSLSKPSTSTIQDLLQVQDKFRSQPRKGFKQDPICIISQNIPE